MRILATKIATSVTLFSVIQQALEHSRHKNPANRGKTLAQSEIDESTRHYIFEFGLVFFLDFVSVWFENYSKYFAGLRLDVVATGIELQF